MAKYNERGHEILDTTPVAVPLNFKRPLPVAEMVRRMVHRELSSAAAAKGYESFEDADDFEVGDEPELRSKYELDEEQANAKFITEEPKNVGREAQDPDGDKIPNKGQKAKAGARAKNNSAGSGGRRKSDVLDRATGTQEGSSGDEGEDE